ncbi:MAG: chaperone NapD [Campylobacterales bacterium]
MNISSVVVKCAPRYLDELLDQIAKLEVGDIYAHDDQGRIIVIIEGETTEEESDKLKKLQALEHVLSAEVAYVYSDTEFGPEDGAFEKVDEALLTTLNSDQDASEIVYRGHLKDR